MVRSAVVGNNTWCLMHYTTLQGILLLAPAVVLSGEFNLAMASPEIASSTFWLFMSQAAIAGSCVCACVRVAGLSVCCCYACAPG